MKPSDYRKYINGKLHSCEPSGLVIPENLLNEKLFPFQKRIVHWALKMGRAAIFADCGLGKTPMQLEWAQQVHKSQGGNILVLAPLAVSTQTVREGLKFDISVNKARSMDDIKPGINITNYEMLGHFDPKAFCGIVLDESSILKSFNGSTRNAVNQFMRKIEYRLLCTATAAPNDYIELGTSSEALGNMGHVDMLNKFFKNDNNNSAQGRMYGEVLKWRFKGHAEEKFWRWVCSWAMAVRKPSDIGFPDDGFVLKDLNVTEHLVHSDKTPEGMLFSLPAIRLDEQRAERKRTIQERCEAVSALTNNTGRPAMVWCHLNDEGDLMEKLIPDAVQVKGSDSSEKKEKALLDFADGKIRVLITKPKIGAWGLNFQNCSHVVYFPSHSYEQYYQAVRRCWRFGQENAVHVDIVTTEGEHAILRNLKRKSKDADRMFSNLVRTMNNSMDIKRHNNFTEKEEIPSWL